MPDAGRLASRLSSSTASASLPRPDGGVVEWCVSDDLVPYDTAVAAMEARVESIARGEAAEQVWLLEHPPLYTAGTSAGQGQAGRERSALPFPLHHTGRGGQVTYHGPGQRIAYVMLDLRRRGPDVRVFVGALERWIIDTLARFDVVGERREDRVGVWVRRPDKAPGLNGAPAEDKIAAIGIRVRRWVTFHGISLNVAPDLSHYAAITPCGIAAAHFGVTSLAGLGHIVSMAEVDAALAGAFEPVFGSVAPPSEAPVACLSRGG